MKPQRNNEKKICSLCEKVDHKKILLDCEHLICLHCIVSRTSTIEKINL